MAVAAKNLATEMTNYNVENKDLYGEPAIKPEELPPAEDIKKLERRTKSQDKKVIEKSGSFSDIELFH